MVVETINENWTI